MAPCSSSIVASSRRNGGTSRGSVMTLLLGLIATLGTDCALAPIFGLRMAVSERRRRLLGLLEKPAEDFRQPAFLGLPVLLVPFRQQIALGPFLHDVVMEFALADQGGRLAGRRRHMHLVVSGDDAGGAFPSPQLRFGRTHHPEGGRPPKNLAPDIQHGHENAPG